MAMITYSFYYLVKGSRMPVLCTAGLFGFVCLFCFTFIYF